jgi:PIN domain nuclease of toxin-antitoxin system
MGLTVLLDTHVLLWALLSPKELSPRVRRMVADRETTVLVSAATAWELATKHRLGKLDEAIEVVDQYEDHLRTLMATEIPITSGHALLAGSLASEHRDPFDRMIAAQAVMLGVPVATRDTAFATFPCRRIW